MKKHYNYLGTDRTEGYKFLIDLVGRPKGGVTIWEDGETVTLTREDLVRELIAFQELTNEEITEISEKGTFWHIKLDTDDESIAITLDNVIEPGEDWKRKISKRTYLDLAVIHELVHTRTLLPGILRPPGLPHMADPGAAPLEISSIRSYIKYRGGPNKRILDELKVWALNCLNCEGPSLPEPLAGFFAGVARGIM